MNIVEALGIAFKVDTSGLDKGFKEAQDKTSDFAKKIQTATSGKLKNLFDSIYNFAQNFSTALAGVLGVGLTAWLSAFIAQLEKMKQEVRALNDLTKEVNADVEDISAWSNAVEFNGGNAKSFQNTLLSLQKDLDNFSVMGKSRNAPILEMLGIDISNASGKPIFNLIDDIAKAVEGMDKSQSRSVLKKLGFDSDTIEIIQSGKKNIDELIAKQKEWGVYTKKDTEALDKMDKSIKQMSLALKTTFIPLFTRVIGTMSKVTMYVLKAATWLRNNLDIVRKAALLLAFVFLDKLLLALQMLGRAAMKNPFVLFIAGLTAFLLLLEDLWIYANEGESAFEGVWEKLGTPKEVLDGFKKIGNLLKQANEFVESVDSGFAQFLLITAFLTKAFLALKVVLAGTFAFIAGIPAVVIGLIAGLIAFLYTYRDELKATFIALGNMFLDFFRIGGVLHKGLQATWEWITESVSEAFESIKNTIQGFIEEIKTTISSIGESIESFFGTTVSTSVSESVNGLKEKWDGFFSYLSDGFKKAKGWLGLKLPDLDSVKLPEFNSVKLPEFKLPDMTKMWDEVASTVTNKTNFIKNVLAELGSYISNAWENVKNRITEVIDAINISDKLAKVKENISAIISFIGSTLALIQDKILSTLSNISEFFAEKFNVVRDIITDIGNAIQSAIRSAIDVVFGVIQTALQSIAEIIKNVIQNAFQSVTNAIIDIVRNASQLIVDIFTDLWNGNVSIVQTALNVISAIWNTYIALVQAELDIIAELWNGLVSAFESGSLSIGNFLANAANIARRAWESFITWLEQKWQWLKDLLPSFANIAEKLPSMSNNVQMAMAGGGNVSNTTTTDNSVNNYTFNATTTQAADRFIEKSGYSSQMNTGVRR